MNELIPSYADIVQDSKSVLDNFLFGNGFSMCFLNDFSYSGLYNTASKHMDSRDMKLFELLTTQNFEMVLKHLDVGRSFNHVFGLDSTELQNSYIRIKAALIKSVQEMHPVQADLDLDRLAWSLSLFKNHIFTTNYDLLGYWGLLQLQECGRDVSDGFGPDNLGNIVFKENFRGLKLLFLHGALHLFQDDSLDALRKVKSGILSLLDSIKAHYLSNEFPLYIAEGTFNTKLNLIKKNKYLSYCLSKLTSLSNTGLTIFGQNLTPDQDQHIIAAINQSSVTCIAYGVHVSVNTDEDIEWMIRAAESRIKSLLPKKKLVFFDSDTFFEYAMEMAWLKAGPPSDPYDIYEFPSIKNQATLNTFSKID
jgi:hypothetical protein